jgi:hypothetical protein
MVMRASSSFFKFKTSSPPPFWTKKFSLDVIVTEISDFRITKRAGKCVDEKRVHLPDCGVLRHFLRGVEEVGIDIDISSTVDEI